MKEPITSREEICLQIDGLVAELESRTSKYKKKRDLTTVLRECSKKIQYQTLRAAHRRANKYTEEFKIKNRVYECPSCGLWHITTKPTHTKSKPSGKSKNG